MADVVISDVSRAVVAALEAAASRAGVSRGEYLRRVLEDAAGESTRSSPPSDILRLRPPADPRRRQRHADGLEMTRSGYRTKRSWIADPRIRGSAIQDL